MYTLPKASGYKAVATRGASSKRGAEGPKKSMPKKRSK